MAMRNVSPSERSSTSHSGGDPDALNHDAPPFGLNHTALIDMVPRRTAPFKTRSPLLSIPAFTVVASTILMLHMTACGPRPTCGDRSANDPIPCNGPEETISRNPQVDEYQQHVPEVRDPDAPVQYKAPAPGESIHASQTVFTFSITDHHNTPHIQDIARLDGKQLQPVETRQFGSRFVIDASLDEGVELAPGLHTLEFDDGLGTSIRHIFRQDERLHLAGVRFEGETNSTQATIINVYFSRPITFLQGTDLCIDDTCLEANQILTSSSVFKLYVPKGSAESLTLSISDVRDDGEEPLSVLEWQKSSPYYTGIEADGDKILVSFERGLHRKPCVQGQRCWGITPLYE